MKQSGCFFNKVVLTHQLTCHVLREATDADIILLENALSLYIYMWETCAQPQGCLLHLILQFLLLLLLLHLLYLLMFYLLVIAVEAVLLLFVSLFPYTCTIKRFFFSFYSVNTSFFLISFVSSCLWMLLLLLFSFLFAATNCPFANGSTLSKNT